MTGVDDQDLRDLAKHLAALKASAQVSQRLPDEAQATARRVAHAVARLVASSGHSNVIDAAHRVIDAPAADLPAAVDDLVGHLERELEELRQPRGVVLLVEDDHWLAELFRHVLAARGWEVVVAGTATEAEALVRDHNVSAIVLDLVLPDADGRNVLFRLKENPQHATIPVLVASAHADPHIQAECLALGASDFLKKPVDPQSLVDLITRRARVLPTVDIDAAGLQSDILGALDTLFEVEPPGAEAVAPAPPRSRLAEFSRLGEAVEAMGEQPHVLAVIAAVTEGPPDGTSAGRPLEQIGEAVAGGLAENEVIARAGAGELAVLLHERDPTDACRRLEAVQESLRLTERAGGGFAAGVIRFVPGLALAEAMDRAGHLLYVALESPDHRILSETQPVPPPTVRILLAEDDELTAKLLVYRLKREPGFEVLHCADGLQALATLEQERIDLAILDVNMPGIDGFDLLSRVRRIPQHARLPIAILTALGSEADVVRGLELGANEYITKPFSPTEVIARIRRLLGRSRRSA